MPEALRARAAHAKAAGRHAQEWQACLLSLLLQLLEVLIARETGYAGPEGKEDASIDGGPDAQ